MKAFMERLFLLYNEIPNEFLACFAGLTTIMNSMSRPSRISLDLDMCHLLLIPPEEYITALFTCLLSSRTDCELAHQTVEEVPVPLWLVQDQLSFTRDSLKTCIISSCSFGSPSWPHLVTQAQERMETPKDIEEIKSSITDLQSGMPWIYRMVGTSVNGNITIVA